MTCPKCGDPNGKHFVPPSLGESGWFICDPMTATTPINASTSAMDTDKMLDSLKAIDDLFRANPVLSKIFCNANAHGTLRDACQAVATDASGVYTGVPIEVDPDIPLDGMRARLQFTDGSERCVSLSKEGAGK